MLFNMERAVELNGDLTVGPGTLALGTGNPMAIVGIDVTIDDNGTVNVNQGSLLLVGNDLSVGVENGGALNINRSGALVEVSDDMVVSDIGSTIPAAVNIGFAGELDMDDADQLLTWTNGTLTISDGVLSLPNDVGVIQGAQPDGWSSRSRTDLDHLRRV